MVKRGEVGKNEEGIVMPKKEKMSLFL